MNRLTLFIPLVCTIILVILLYDVRNGHNAERLALHGLDKKIEAAQIEHQTMRAEWSSLNNPARLSRLAAKYLRLAPPQNQQMMSRSIFEDDAPSVSLALSARRQ